MVNPISRVSQQVARPQEVKAATPKTEVTKTEPKKPEAVTPKAAAPVREAAESKVEEVKEKPAAESAEALRTLASREPNTPTATAGRNTVSADSVIAAYKK